MARPKQNQTRSNSNEFQTISPASKDLLLVTNAFGNSLYLSEGMSRSRNEWSDGSTFSVVPKQQLPPLPFDLQEKARTSLERSSKKQNSVEPKNTRHYIDVAGGPMKSTEERRTRKSSRRQSQLLNLSEEKVRKSGTKASSEIDKHYGSGEFSLLIS